MTDIISTPDFDAEAAENTSSSPLEASKTGKRSFFLSITDQGKIHLKNADTIIIGAPPAALSAVAAWFNGDYDSSGTVTYKNRRRFNNTFVADFVQLVLD